MTAVGCGAAKVNPPQHSIKQCEKCGLMCQSACKNCTPKHTRAIIYRRSISGFGMSITSLESPRYPKCKERMVAVRSGPGCAPEAWTFKCMRCGERKLVETADPLNEVGGWLSARDLQPPE